MTVRRVMGIETEYGVLQPGSPMANPMLMSSQVVNAYRALVNGARPPRWDYFDEDPLADARGFRLDRASAHPSLLTDDPDRPAPSGPTAATGDAMVSEELARPDEPAYDDPSASNAILTNGARLYVDHAHPEYSSPEVTNPRDLVTWDAAGERVVLAASRELARVGIDIVLYKNNIDGKGASYGTHENYLVDRAVPFDVIVSFLTSFLVTRQIFTGSGRVGLGQTGQEPGYQLSQRADYIEAEVGLETTLRRPIINTRDEPHADRSRWRRLHLIIGDANMFEAATLLKAGSASAVLFVLENLHNHPEAGAALEELRLADPVGAVQQVSRDLDLSVPLALASGRFLTALEIQQEYLRVVQHVMRAQDSLDPDSQEIIERWQDVLTRLGRSRSQCSRDVEWVAKLRLLEGMRRRHGSGWDDPRLTAFDLQWTDVRPERGLAHKLLAAGAIEQIAPPDAIASAVHHAPTDTRAFFRGESIARFAQNVSAASWDSVIFDIPGAQTLKRVPMPDPLRGTAQHVGQLFAEHSEADDFLSALLG